MNDSLRQANEMIDLFVSVGASAFHVTKTDLEQGLIWGKPYDVAPLREKLPAMLRTAAILRPRVISGAEAILAGENIMIRPRSGNLLIQLDDLKPMDLDHVREGAFGIFTTSHGNHQAWIAVADAPQNKDARKEFTRRVRRTIEGADEAASGSVRLAGTRNFKVKYAPDFPRVQTIEAYPGRVLTKIQLDALGLVAPPEPPKQWTPVVASERSGNAGSYRWPDYQKCLAGAPLNSEGTGPDRSKADYTFCLFAAQRGHFTVEEIAGKLLEVSERARERVGNRDDGYPRITAENAAAAAQRGRQQARAL